ncbi:hypothetical protein JL720_6526 [Aureococcus anophagefferens]|nr:hypothetical protein JL720_6526 [Aureococcus anophagefferens]
MSNELTVAAIKKHSGQYDLELVRRLAVSNARLAKIANVEHCVNLVALNLSGNKIINVEGLDALVQLARLDLSRNQIRKALDGGRLSLRDDADAIAAELADAAPDAPAPARVADWLGRDFDWRATDRAPAPLKAAYAQRDAADAAAREALFQATTDCKHLAQDMDAELDKSRALLADLFPEDADPLGLGQPYGSAVQETRRGAGARAEVRKSACTVSG